MERKHAREQQKRTREQQNTRKERNVIHHLSRHPLPLCPCLSVWDGEECKFEQRNTNRSTHFWRVRTTESIGRENQLEQHEKRKERTVSLSLLTPLFVSNLFPWLLFLNTLNIYITQPFDASCETFCRQEFLQGNSFWNKKKSYERKGKRMDRVIERHRWLQRREWVFTLWQEKRIKGQSHDWIRWGTHLSSQWSVSFQKFARSWQVMTSNEIMKWKRLQPALIECMACAFFLLSFSSLIASTAKDLGFRCRQRKNTFQPLNVR